MKFILFLMMFFSILVPSWALANNGITGCPGFGMMGAFGGWMWLWMIFGGIISILVTVLLVVLIWKLLEKK